MLQHLSAQVDKLVADSKLLQAQLGEIQRAQRARDHPSAAPTARSSRPEQSAFGWRGGDETPQMRASQMAGRPDETPHHRPPRETRGTRGSRGIPRNPGHPSAMLEELGARSHAGSYDVDF